MFNKFCLQDMSNTERNHSKTGKLNINVIKLSKKKKKYTMVTVALM